MYNSKRRFQHAMARCPQNNDQSLSILADVLLKEQSDTHGKKMASYCKIIPR